MKAKMKINTPDGIKRVEMLSTKEMMNMFDGPYRTREKNGTIYVNQSSVENEMAKYPVTELDAIHEMCRVHVRTKYEKSKKTYWDFVLEQRIHQ